VLLGPGIHHPGSGGDELTVLIDIEAGPVRYEPCSAYDDPSAEGCCSGCGWTLDDHEAAELLTAA